MEYQCQQSHTFHLQGDHGYFTASQIWGRKQQPWVEGRCWDTKGSSMQLVQGMNRAALLYRRVGRAEQWHGHLWMNQSSVLGRSPGRWPTSKGLFPPWTRDSSGKLLHHKGIFAFLSFSQFYLTPGTGAIVLARGYEGIGEEKSYCLLPALLHHNTIIVHKGRFQKPWIIFCFRLTLAILSPRQPFRTGFFFFFWG